jgi:hypothetical protein
MSADSANGVLVGVRFVGGAVTKEVQRDDVVVSSKVIGDFGVVVRPGRESVEHEHYGPLPAPPEGDAMSPRLIRVWHWSIHSRAREASVTLLPPSDLGLWRLRMLRDW